MTKNPVDIIGIMTGNSLDAVDAVLTRFEPDGDMTDIAFRSVPYPEALKDGMRKIRAWIKSENYAVGNVVTHIAFLGIVTAYAKLLAQCVGELLDTTRMKSDDIVALGVHGQTCAHCPPSACGDGLPYTVQICHPQLLANLTGIPVIYDFRSDDVFNGGEGAPFAPAHNLHMARSMGLKGTVAFVNAGNTGNLAVVGGRADFSDVVGFDCGPFNHFPDLIVRRFFRQDCDKDGQFGRQGKIDSNLLRAFFENGARTFENKNFYTQKPPKSSDPQWYVFPDGIKDANPFDSVRTAEYAAVYGLFYNLSFLKVLPETFVLFGGGWNNPLSIEDFKALLEGKGAVLPEHREIFGSILSRMPSVPRLEKSRTNGTYTEARIFADAAYRFILNEPFTFPETTGVRKPTVCGVYCLPQVQKDYALIREMRVKKAPEAHPLLCSRASRRHAF